MTVIILEVFLPLTLSLYVIALLTWRKESGLSAAARLTRLLRQVPLLAIGAATAALIAWFLTPSRSLLTLLELEILWLGPAVLWSGVALAASRKGKRRGYATRRTSVAVVLFALPFALAILLSWFSAIGPVQGILLSPRPVEWGPINVIPVGEWLELFLPAVVSFHGRVDAWAWNRLLLIIFGLLLWGRAAARARAAVLNRNDDGAYTRLVGAPEEVAQLKTAGKQLVLPALLVGLVPPAVAATWPSDCTDWRLGWCEGRIDVLADPDNPGLGTLNISYMTHPGRHDGEPKETLVFAAGGPTAVSWDLDMILSSLGEIADDYDLLISDYRGFGRSSYTSCPGVAIGGDDQDAVEECQKRLGPLASLLSGRHAAVDLETIRTKLGLGPVNVYGESYGTFFAQAYAMAYPDSVRAMVLDSTLPLHTGDWVFNHKDPIPGVAADGTVSGLAARWAAVVEQVRESGGTNPSVDDLAVIDQYAFWPDFAEQWEAALGLSGEEQLAALAELSSQVRERIKAMRDDPIMATMPPQPDGIYGCNDYLMPFPKDADLAEREQGARDYARANFGASIVPFTWEEMNEAQRGVNGLRVDGFVHQQCLYWDYPAGSDASDVEVPDVPVLLISGLVDDSTTPAMSRDVADLWNGSIVSVVDGDHFVLWDTERACAREAASRFFADPENNRESFECGAGE